MLTAESIAKAAWECFEKNGEAGLSLRRVAARLGVTPMALYRHFANRQALVDELAADALGEWRARVAAIAPGAPANWLARIADSYLDFALSCPRRYEAAFLLPSAAALRYPDDFLAGKSSAGNLELDLLDRLDGSARREELAGTLIGMTALAQGLVTLYRAGRIAGGESAFRALFGRQMTHFLASLRAGAEA